MRNMIFFSAIFMFFGCASFHPKNFTLSTFNEELITLSQEKKSFQQVLEESKGKKSLIEIYASYCPVSQDSFGDVLTLQKEYPEINYIFLSVDHDFSDFKKGVENIKPKGQFYYLSKKDKGVLGQFLKLKTIPRFLLLDEKGNIEVFKSSKISETITTKL